MLLRRIAKHLKQQDWFAVALDFVIVVVGVYVGLQAQSWFEAAKDQDRLDRMVAALKADIADSRRVEARFRADVKAGLAAFEAAYARGEQPAPFVYRIDGSDTPPNLMLASLQNAGIGVLLDPTLLFELSHFYSERDGVGVKVTRYMTRIEQDVLPYLEGDPAFFYDASGKVMKPEYLASMDRLREWSRYIEQLAPWSECLERRLDAASEPGPSCRVNWDTNAAPPVP